MWCGQCGREVTITNFNERFAAQRRALLEAEGPEVNVRTLEEAAKALQKPP